MRQLLSQKRPLIDLKVHPYRHDIEIGVSFKGKRFRDFKGNMTMKDFVPVAIC